MELELTALEALILSGQVLLKISYNFWPVLVFIAGAAVYEAKKG
jgi:hypothetical protein